MRDPRDPLVLSEATLAEHVTALKVANALAHLHEQRARATLGPDRSDTNGRSSQRPDPAGNNATEAARIALEIDNGEDFKLGFKIAHRALLAWAERATRLHAFHTPRGAVDEAATTYTGERCNGQIDPLCENFASEHHDPETGQTIESICDACWAKACPSCFKRPAASDRRGLCEACRRRQLRNGEKGTHEWAT